MWVTQYSWITMQIKAKTRKIDDNNPLEELHTFDEQIWQSWGSTALLTDLQQVWLLLPPLATQPLFTIVWPAVAPVGKIVNETDGHLWQSIKPGTRTLKQLKWAADGAKSSMLRRLFPAGGVNSGSFGSRVVGIAVVGICVVGAVGSGW